jgi:hypothetical protein
LLRCYAELVTAVRRAWLCIGITGLACLACAAEPLQYQGIGMDTDLSSLIGRFPKSFHAVCCLNQFEVWLNTQPDEFREALAHGSGDYSVRIAAAESVAHVYYLLANFQNGVWSKFRLSFERPEQIRRDPRYREQSHSRMPACAPVMAELTGKYGKPGGPEFGSEEALERNIYTWSGPEGEMQLVCGKYQGERFVFAMDVFLKPSRR